MSRYIINFLCILFNLLTFSAAKAETINVNISVAVVSQVCDIISSDNSNKPISIDFKDILAPKIDGSNYQEEIKFNLVCTNSEQNPALKLKVSGNEGFKDGVLATDKDGLGIIFRLGGDILPLENWVNFTYKSMPKLTAAPIIKKGVSISGGDFIATATLIVEYQ